MGTANNGRENIMFKMSMIFTKEDMDRVSIKKEQNENLVLKADLHNMRYWEAYHFVNNLIALNSDPFELDIIHGYNHGTVLKDMVQKDLNNPRIKSKMLIWWNEGETLLSID